MAKSRGLRLWSVTGMTLASGERSQATTAVSDRRMSRKAGKPGVWGRVTGFSSPIPREKEDRQLHSCRFAALDARFQASSSWQPSLAAAPVAPANDPPRGF